MFSLEHLHIYKPIHFKNNRGLSIPLDDLPQQDRKGFLIDSKKEAFARIEYGSVAFEGGYGTLQMCERTDLSGSKQAIVKIPRHGADLGPECLIQILARDTLSEKGLGWVVPMVYDLFARGGEICFSMEFIKGDFPYVYLQEVETPALFFFQVLEQICVFLHILESRINLDHRDLKANNIYIRPRPCSFSVDLSGSEYVVEAPFQVVLLDFGFACLGNEKRISKINLDTNSFSNADPCPKEGRDLFHLISSFWSIPSIRNRMPALVQEEIDSWFMDGKRNFSKVIKNHKDIEWTYLVTQDPTFTYPMLSPLRLLKRIQQLKDK